MKPAKEPAMRGGERLPGKEDYPHLVLSSGTPSPCDHQQAPRNKQQLGGKGLERLPRAVEGSVNQESLIQPQEPSLGNEGI